jgi:NSS family neurotransmitter:Na+ symporter
LLESIISHLEESMTLSRAKITWVTGVLLWLIGLATVFSFNAWKNFVPLGFISHFSGKTIFELIDYFGSNVLMPLGGILMAVLAGWLLNKEKTLASMNVPNPSQLNLWHKLIRYIVPLILIWLWWYLI